MLVTHCAHTATVWIWKASFKPLGHKNIPVPLQQPVCKRQELLKNWTGKETNVGSVASK